MPNTLSIRGAREHNLQGFDLDLAQNALHVITGPSGSGKSSLAFDTIYQEGQRRFVESLSAYARQFLGQMERPRVDRIDGLTPTLSIDQKTVNRNPRSTVGTTTEIYDHLRLLFARLGQPHCPVCDRPISRTSPAELAARLLAEHPGGRLILLAPVVRDRKGEYRKELEGWLRDGWLRARIDGALCSLEEPPALARYEKHTLELVVDRLTLHPSELARLIEGIERALKLAEGLCATLIGQETGSGEWQLHAVDRSCPEHGASVPELEPRLFSFNAPQGACPACAGLGLLPTGDELRPMATCPACRGRRLNPVALAVRFREHRIDTLCAASVDEARRFFDTVEFTPREWKIAETLVREIRDRLHFLDTVGLGYLHLDRRSDTLSGGEAQRIRLAACVGSGLQGVTYVLDEPSIGLHPRDNGRLLDALGALRDVGNTVIVVEHDREAMERADNLVDIGPGAGRLGGHLLGAGPPARFAQLDTPTARFLRGEDAIPMPARRRAGNGQFLCVHGATTHNLQGVDVAFPLGTLTVLTGVSGSGKSTLMSGVLEARVREVVHRRMKDPAQIRRELGLSGLANIDKLITIDQAPIGRTPRSNPGTYTGVFDIIRELFAALPESAARGYTAGRFSFNVAGGRCEGCEGNGVRKVEMQFLSDVDVPCESCGGRRYNAETLEIRWRDNTIADILDMTVAEAIPFFSAQPRVLRSLQAMAKVGLDYVQLGQAATTLSGGEAQRLKLAAELQRPATGHTLYLLDEPTTGLHFLDIGKLILAMQALVDAGNTLVIIEHNTDVIKIADHLIELGPEGGSGGGRLLAAGTPEEIARLDTATGRVLAALPEFGAVPAVLSEGRAAYTVPALTGGGGMLTVEGARCHNLKGVRAEIPHGKLTVITGPSGSGKTSLAFDTIFAEGQRRYVEALNTYARRFLGRLERPLVDRIQGLAPAIAIDQKNSAHNPRSTVATVTEIHDYLRILYANLGTPHCPRCDRPARALPPGPAAGFLAALRPGRGHLIARLPDPAPAAELLRQGFQRAWVVKAGAKAGASVKPETSVVQIEDLGDAPVQEVVIDRFDPAVTERSRVAEAVASAYRAGRARFQPAAGEAVPLSPWPECPQHGRVHREPLTPRHFSFNHHLGACTACNGLGRTPWTTSTCPRCLGARLRPEILAVRLCGVTLGALAAKTVAQAAAFFRDIALSPTEAAIADQALIELRSRLRFLQDVGLEYLTLDRGADTLSGGESQRIRLASQLGSGLTGCVYVLDEPTVGLHPRDTARLLGSLEGLRALGNTLIVVEHDLDTMRRADHLIDLGPEAGDRGGELLYSGPPMLAGPDSVTGPWLSGARRIPAPATRRAPGPPIRVRGARRHNLQDLSVDIPTGVMVGVTGVSGSGKSTLIMDLVVERLKLLEEKGAASGAESGAASGSLPVVALPPGAFTLQIVDQAPIGRSPRSCPATYVGVLDPIRALFAQLPLSVERGYTAGRFSYNGAGEGACPHCEGQGQTQVEMHFLSNVWVTCEQCRGRRYNPQTLDVRFRGRTIADVLAMRADEARELFGAQRRILRPLQSLCDVGLGYLRLGQPSTELSGGEAQRIKLACGLMSRVTLKPTTKKPIYILDEPTTGLHLNDVEKLVAVLDRLVDAGSSVILVEHNLELIRRCDWLIDLGPEAGAGGGRVVAQGTPEQVARTVGSHTGAALRASL